MGEHLTPEKRVLLISKGQGLSNADQQALEAAGYIVVRIKFPADVRFITGESPPMTASQMLKAAIIGLRSNTSSWSTEMRAKAWDALVKLILEETP